jgi:hypothetical protein
MRPSREHAVGRAVDVVAEAVRDLTVLLFDLGWELTDEQRRRVDAIADQLQHVARTAHPHVPRGGS